MSNTDVINSSTTAIRASDFSDYYSDYYETDTSASPCDNSTVEGFGQIFLPIVYSLTFILGFIGNGLVLCVFAKHRSRINVTDICLLNMAISDLLFVLSMPFYSYTAAVGSWIFGAFMCHLITSLFLMGFYGGIFSVIVMTLDRYVIIMHPTTLGQHRSFRWGVAMTIFVWVLSFSLSLPTIALMRPQRSSSGWHCSILSESAALKDFQILSNNIFGLVIPLLVMVICYSRILPSLKTIRSAKKHHIVRLVITIMVVFFLFWTPYTIVLFLYFLMGKNETLFNDCEMVRHMVLSIKVTEAIAFTHCCLNPIIYAFVGQKFAGRALRLLHAWVPCVFRRIHTTGSSRKRSVSTSTFTM